MAQIKEEPDAAKSECCGNGSDPVDFEEGNDTALHFLDIVKCEIQDEMYHIKGETEDVKVFESEEPLTEDVSVDQKQGTGPVSEFVPVLKYEDQIPSNMSNSLWEDKKISEPEQEALLSTETLSKSIVPRSLNILDQFEGQSDGLLPYNIHLSSEIDYNDYPEKNKTRNKRGQIQKSNWFAEKNRKLRENGKRYYGRRKEEEWNYQVPKKPRTMKTRCQCKETAQGTLKCSKVKEDDREDIFKHFWNLSWAEKKMFVDGLVMSIPVKRPRRRKDNQNSRRVQSLLYYLRIQDERLKVCRTMFLNTLGIGRWTVQNWKNKLSNKEQDVLATASTSKPFAKECDTL